MEKETNSKQEYKTIQIKVFKENNNLATCRKNVIEECIFLKNHKYGSINVCDYSGLDIFRYSETGHLKPNEKCPLWSNEND